MDILYVVALHEPIEGITHIAVGEEIRDARRIHISGQYGTMVDGEFEPGAITGPFHKDIRGEELDDLDEQSVAAGRPKDKPRHTLDSGDVAVWLAEDADVVQVRLEARRPKPKLDPA